MEFSMLMLCEYCDLYDLVKILLDHMEIYLYIKMSF